mmetsp:Transcript_9343/g.38321  ORF Transcript_9343/g.38321 Transcript_9343/m.38321 type:complete len:85 (-) Transcript_9343:97-351(-)
MDSFAMDLARRLLACSFLLLAIAFGWYLMWVFFLQEIKFVRVLMREVGTSILSLLRLAPPKKERKKRARSTSINAPAAIPAFRR